MFFYHFIQKSLFTKNYFLLLRSIWLPGVHYILVLFYYFFLLNFVLTKKCFCFKKVLIDWKNCCDRFNCMGSILYFSCFCLFLNRKLLVDFSYCFKGKIMKFFLSTAYLSWYQVLSKPGTISK